MSSFTVATPAFSGPLDTLLDLIEARKLPVSSVALSEVTDSYLAYVESLPSLPLAETAQFIVVASTLLLIKSRSLLPTLDLSEEEELSVEELERRLKKLRIIRDAAKELKKVWGVAPLPLAQRAPAKPVIFAPGEVSKESLFRAIQKMLTTLPVPEKVVRASVAPVVALEDVITRVRNRLSVAVRASFRDMVRNAADKHEVIVYFLAMLELVRSGSASVTQEKIFDDITIEIEHLGTPRYGV